MSAASLSLSPFGRFARLIAGPDVLSSPALLPKPIRQLLSRKTDRPERSAHQRTGQQAMIVSPVRIQHLIALLDHSSSVPFLGELPAGPDGLFEEDPLRRQHGTRGLRGSARKGPQVCGKAPAYLFDVAGLTDWLRERHPRSTPISVEADTGIPAGSVENWLHRRSQPSVEHFTTLLAVYGPSLLRSCLRRPPEWVEQAAVTERSREIDEQIARLNRERSALSSSEGT